MTPEQLLQCDYKTLAALTNEQLYEYYKPYLKVTRPELAEKPSQMKHTTNGKPNVTARNQKQFILDELKKRGITDVTW